MRKIIPLGESEKAGWAMLSDQGILVSDDLRSWEPRNTGFPVKTLKLYTDGKKSFAPGIQEIKDLEVNPQNPEIMVAALKNGVYLTRNGGRNWASLGMPPYNTNGIKAVAAFSLAGDLTVFCSHSVYGIYYINPDTRGAKWTELNGGLEQLETTGNPDEVADLAVVFPDFQSTAGAGLYASQTFRRRIYKLDWEAKRFDLIWSDNSEFGTVDSLSPGKNTLRFVRDGGISELSFPAPDRRTQTSRPPLPKERKDLADFIKTIPKNLELSPLCAVIWENTRDAPVISLSELWLLDEGLAANPLAEEASGREGLYLPVNHAMENRTLKPYFDTLKNRSLDMVVIDMKDDYGRLRFTPRGKALEGWGRVFWPIDIDSLLKEMKARNIYTIARVVVFKDPEAARKAGGKYAVWDAKNNKPWEGYSNAADIEGSLYDERWVDPYSEEIWDYIALVAEELHDRGFDEIQFDYIRFPTDGLNLGDAQYRWRDPGMDMDAAILSFLQHVRSRVKAPISVDIYGANGWYRTGARTGQEVELLAPWVDVICPMYYPSHFEQDFLAQDPPEMRPYRIYYLGTLRTRRIARGKIIVRPWLQAFYLNVSYDRKYYDLDYVRRQTEGVRDAGTGGFTYWNNSGRYDDIPVP
ncbi:putative glycoside hydrolase [Leadbettera azotonutricia]|uniref:putative glycoside hydrolase n=1 Tax=Leadbettera azotonutricia TaxID=150829 RepID=UPI0002E41534|nr:putative glycoside hydrolase [Leadbettera azotonutricia]